MRLSPFAPLVPFAEVRASLPDHEFVEIDGQQIHLIDQGDGPTIFLLHGFAASAHTFRELVPLLAKDFRVLALDLNGFGSTERPSNRADYSRIAQARLIRRLAEALGIREVTVVGHSYGASVAMTIAQEYPDFAERLVLVSPAASFPPPPWYLRNGIALRAAYWATRGLLSQPERFRRIIEGSFHRPDILTDSLSEYYRRSMLVEGFKTAFFGYATGIARFGAPAPEAVPLSSLVIAGKHDQRVSVNECEGLARRLPKAELLVLSDCGHSPPEERPDELAAAVGGFMTSDHSG